MNQKEKAATGAGSGQKTLAGTLGKQIEYIDFTNKCQAIVLQAVQMADKGLSVLPVEPKLKKPLEAWKHLQNTPLTPHQLSEKKLQGIALICGKVSNHLEAIDFDGKGIWFEPWEKLVEAEAPGLTKKLLRQNTQSGGDHIIYRCPGLEIPGNLKLASDKIPVDGPGEHEYQGKKYKAYQEAGQYFIYPCMIETRGEGGYFLVAPTPGYQNITGHSFFSIPEITPREREILFKAAKALNKRVEPAREPRHCSEPDDRPGDLYNAKNDIPRNLLEKHGWTRVRDNKLFEYWTRPGKDRGVSASVIDGKLFYVFSSNAAPFEPEQTYTPFQVLTLLEYGGDFEAAAKDLRGQGYYSQDYTVSTPPEKPAEKQAWTFAREILPRTSYPWDILPETIANSLNALARSCATDTAPLPGVALAMIAAAMGRKIAISPKVGWIEPVILWPIDIRDSGEGKTPPTWLLAKVLRRVQEQVHKTYQQKLKEWQDQPPKKRGKPPEPPRGYLVTDLTLEGLRTELEEHPTGGIIALLNEASTLISGQNQYKQKGTDREAWLTLHDGHPARVVRAGRTVFIAGARVQVVGGIQPEIFKRVFGGDEGQYLADGTVFRCLFTYSPADHHLLTADGWSDADRGPWENVLQAALEWADRADSTIRLTHEAQEIFFSWRNELDMQKTRLPREIKGFLPKSYGYALRLAAAIDCLHQFEQGQEPRPLLDTQGIERGIKAAMFYLGQAVDAIRLILGDELIIDPVQAKILEALEAGHKTATEIYTDVFHRNRTSKEIQEALNQLLEREQITETREGTPGRTKNIFSLGIKKVKKVKKP